MTNNFTSHDGTIKSNPAQAGYVFFRSEDWDLPDNTQGKIGWYGVYHMQDDRLTDAMRTAGCDHNAARYEKDRAESAKAEERQHAADMTPVGPNAPCPKCHTYCCDSCDL